MPWFWPRFGRKLLHDSRVRIVKKSESCRIIESPLKALLQLNRDSGFLTLWTQLMMNCSSLVPAAYMHVVQSTYLPLSSSLPVIPRCTGPPRSSTACQWSRHRVPYTSWKLLFHHMSQLCSMNRNRFHPRFPPPFRLRDSCFLVSGGGVIWAMECGTIIWLMARSPEEL
jgi:hypothetical protein